FARGLQLVDIRARQTCCADDRRGARSHRGEGVVECFRRPRKVDESTGTLLVQKSREVIATPDAANEVDARIGLESCGEDRADPAAVTRNTNPDGVSHHGCLPTCGEERAAREGLTLMASAITVASPLVGRSAQR